MRPLTACAQCRAGKRKCDRTADSVEPCTQCRRRGIPCSAANPNPEPTPPQPPLTQQLAPAPSKEKIYLVDLYFKYIHNQPHSLFHEATFKTSVLEGTASDPVLLGMMGMSARYICGRLVKFQQELSVMTVLPPRSTCGSAELRTVLAQERHSRRISRTSVLRTYKHVCL